MSVRIARVFGWYLIAVALAVGAQFTVEFLYESAPITPNQIWFILDWFSLVGFLACIVANFRYKESVRDLQEAVWEKIASNTAFYLSIVLALAFIHNFVGSLAGGRDDLLFWNSSMPSKYLCLLQQVGDCHFANERQCLGLSRF